MSAGQSLGDAGPELSVGVPLTKVEEGSAPVGAQEAN